MSVSRVSSLQDRPTSLAQLRKFASGGYLYALLDAYNAPSVLTKVQEFGKEKAVSLFMGQAETKYWNLAPYLISVDEAALDWTLETICSSPCGILIFSKSGLETLRTHFRRFLMVQLPDGERWFFRYYDPRILRVYLQNCRPDELAIFFGPVRAFGIADESTQGINLLHTTEENQTGGEPPTSSSSVWHVRPEQYRALENPPRNLEDRLLSQVKGRFPQRCSELGENGSRELIQNGLRRAQSYSLSREEDLCGFVELTFLLGGDFDHNPKLPWISAILTESGTSDASNKFRRILEIAERGQQSVP